MLFAAVVGNSVAVVKNPRAPATMSTHPCIPGRKPYLRPEPNPSRQYLRNLDR